MEHEVRPTEIKDLNKTQLILLAILLSFVVSIATGIVTVTLMQQASPAVNQTINRVVQHTIEKVVPDYSSSKVQTVVVKEDDLIVDAVEKVRSAISKVYFDQSATSLIADSYNFGKGIFISSEVYLESGKSYFLSDKEKFYEAKVTSISPLGFSVLVDSKIDDFKNFPVVSTSKDSSVKPGQSIAIVSSNSISKFIVQYVDSKEQKDDTGKVVNSWKIINVGQGLQISQIGSIAVNVEGDVIGLVVPKGEEGVQIVGVDSLNNAVANVAKISGTPALSAEVLPAIQ